MMHIYDDDICIDIGVGGWGVTTCTTMINDHQNCIDSDNVKFIWKVLRSIHIRSDRSYSYRSEPSYKRLCSL